MTWVDVKKDMLVVPNHVVSYMPHNDERMMYRVDHYLRSTKTWLNRSSEESPNVTHYILYPSWYAIYPKMSKEENDWLRLEQKRPQDGQWCVVEYFGSEFYPWHNPYVAIYRDGIFWEAKANYVDKNGTSQWISYLVPSMITHWWPIPKIEQSGNSG